MLYTNKVGCVCASVLLAFVVASAGYADTIVTFQTVMGDFDVQLYDSAVPGTVANFLSYVNSGRYTDSFFHRLPTGFVLQGGGFTYDGSTDNFGTVDSFGPIVNEFDPTRSNLRGTLAMAKVGGDPDSTTSEFFINLGDNSQNLDNQNGGFTVFGEVIGHGMAVVDQLASVPTFPLEVLNTQLQDIPLRNYTTGNPVGIDNLEIFDVVLHSFDDGFIGDNDFVALMANWGRTGMTLRDGDLTGDEFVGSDDLEVLFINWGQAWSTLEEENLDGDGSVEANDYAELLNSYGSVGANDYAEVLNNSANAVVPMPEPATLGLLLLGGLALLKRRR